MSAAMKILAMSVFVAGCASQQGGQSQSSGTPAASTPSAASKAGQGGSATRTVKSRDGKFEGEIVGTPADKSKFAKLQIGMPMREVTSLIGGPDDMIRHETGKRWIPFYFGNDSQRLQVLYKGEGCLTYTGGNVFGGGENELIRIAVDPKTQCMGD
jgi:hypothetical protein